MSCCRIKDNTTNKNIVMINKLYEDAIKDDLAIASCKSNVVIITKQRVVCRLSKRNNTQDK